MSQSFDWPGLLSWEVADALLSERPDADAA
jgi:hypothetical protein